MDTSSLINTAEYFGAANTSRGFENYFPNIFNPKKFDRIYIIKGGPGSGKSTIMKKIAKAAVQKGYEPILYRCSSDVQSLDGIIGRERRFCRSLHHEVKCSFAGQFSMGNAEGERADFFQVLKEHFLDDGIGFVHQS